MDTLRYDPLALKELLHTQHQQFELCDADLWQRYRRCYGISLQPQTKEGYLLNVTHRARFLEVEGEKVAVQMFEQNLSASSSILVHGYYDHTGLMRHLIRYCLMRGMNVICFDLPGHGLSTGPIAAIDDFAQYQRVLSEVIALREALGWGDCHIMGQSTGAAIIMDHLLRTAAQEEGAVFQKAVLFAPLVYPGEWWWAKMAHRVLSPFCDYVPRQFSTNTNDESFANFLKEVDPLQSKFLSARWVGALLRWIPYFKKLPSSNRSVLILQGDADGTVAFRKNLRILKRKFAQADIVMLAGAKHHLVNEIDEHRERIADELDRYLFGD